MATPSDRQDRDDRKGRAGASQPHLGDASFANQNIFNTERHQTDDLRRSDVLDETGEVSTAAVLDRTPRAAAGREDPADRQNVGTYDERRDEIEADEKTRPSTAALHASAEPNTRLTSTIDHAGTPTMPPST